MAIVIGIDTGVNTGVAVKRNDAYQDVGCMKIHQAMFLVLEWQEAAQEAGIDFKVYVEDARQRKWFGNQSQAKIAAKAQGAGSVKRDATIWKDFLKDHQIPFEMVPPRAGATKLPNERFQMLTKWAKKTNEHARDAAMLILNRHK